MKQTIWALCGPIGSGKNLAARMMQEYLPRCLVHSFAGPVKDVVSTMFGYPRELLEGDTPESRKWREQPDEYWSATMGKEVTPRWLMQYIGTDLIRKQFFSDFWVDRAKHFVIQNPDARHIIFPDLRFSNELRLIQELNGEIIRVDRPGYDVQGHDTHSSEHSLPDDCHTRLLKNWGCVEHLENRVHGLLYFMGYDPLLRVENDSDI